MVVNEYEIDHYDPQKIPSGRCILTLYLTTTTQVSDGINGQIGRKSTLKAT